MKPKDYLKEFELSADKFNNRQFVSKIRNQLYEDFIDLITKTRVTPNTFKNITKQLMDKVNIIMNLSDLSDEQKRKKFSGYIYASVIIKERNYIQTGRKHALNINSKLIKTLKEDMIIIYFLNRKTNITNIILKNG